MQITVLTLLDTATRIVETHFLSEHCGGSESSELWIGSTSGRFVVVDPGLYYDDALRQRRNSGNMLSPWQPVERLSLVAQVWGTSTAGKAPGVIEIARGLIEASRHD